jgi:hypothetical protein
MTPLSNEFGAALAVLAGTSESELRLGGSGSSRAGLWIGPGRICTSHGRARGLQTARVVLPEGATNPTPLLVPQASHRTTPLLGIPPYH